MLAAIARPYAKAAFEYADENKVLPQWQAFLQTLAPVVQDRAVKKILLNPKMDKSKLADVLVGAIKSLPQGAENFLRLLALKHRLNLLPRIAELFTEYYSREEKVLAVEVTTAHTLTAQQNESLQTTLQKHFNKTITMQNHIDETLLGGVLIRADDLVIDASVRGKLKKLAQELV